MMSKKSKIFRKLEISKKFPIKKEPLKDKVYENDILGKVYHEKNIKSAVEWLKEEDMNIHMNIINEIVNHLPEKRTLRVNKLLMMLQLNKDKAFQDVIK